MKRLTKLVVDVDYSPSDPGNSRWFTERTEFDMDSLEAGQMLRYKDPGGLFAGIKFIGSDDKGLSLEYSGRTITLNMATDSCHTFRTADGSYFTYGNGEEALRQYGSSSVIGQTFWGLFGLTNSYEDIY